MGLFGNSSSSKQPTQYVAPPAPPKTVNFNNVQNNMEMRVTELENQIKKAEEEIARNKAEMQRHRPGTTAYNSSKQRALRALQRRNMYQKQLDSKFANMANLDQMKFAQESLKDAQQTATIMQQSNKVMQQELNKINVDQVEDLQDDMEDLLQEVGDMQDALSRTYGIGELDDAEIAAELEEFETELAGPVNAPSYLQPGKVPNAPVSVDDELAQLESEINSGPTALKY